MNLDLFYENSNVEGKRYPNELLFSEKMEYSGDLYYRTRRVNEIAEIMYLINNKLKAIKKGKRLLKIFCPVTGWLMGLEPTTLGTTNQYSNQLSYNHRVF